MTDSSKRIVLITGANKGIGLETARQLGGKGMTILLGVRDIARGEAATEALRTEGVDAHLAVLDVTDRTSIEAAAIDIQTRYGRLDVLVNNAGITDPQDGLISEASIAAVRRIYDVNVFGVLDVIQVMLPLLRASEAGRIVNVSSGLGSFARHNDPTWPDGVVQILGYNTSKSALNMITVLLAKELAGSSVKVNAVAPGYTATDLNGGVMPGAQTVEEGAEASVIAALLPEHGQSGGFIGRFEPEPW